MKSQDLRTGMAIQMDGQLWLVAGYDHVKPGKGPAYLQVKLRNVKTGAHQERRFRSGEEVSETYLDRRELIYLYSDSTGAVFMDNQSYNQVAISSDVLGNAQEFLVENTAIIGLCHDSNILSIEMPPVVELKVTDTPPGIKDATKNTQLKEATCQTGLKTRVPPFVEIGDVIKVSTDTGQYQGRA